MGDLFIMVRYAREPAKENTSAKAHGRDLRVHFKTSRETAMAIRGMELNRAKKYLEDVIAHKDIVPFRRFTTGPGHHAQCKNHTWAIGRWPEKSCRFLLKLLQNAEANAESKGLDSENLFITHIQVNRAPKIRRRTYRATVESIPTWPVPATLNCSRSRR